MNRVKKHCKIFVCVTDLEQFEHVKMLFNSLRFPYLNVYKQIFFSLQNSGSVYNAKDRLLNLQIFGFVTSLSCTDEKSEEISEESQPACMASSALLKVIVTPIHNTFVLLTSKYSSENLKIVSFPGYNTRSS